MALVREPVYRVTFSFIDEGGSIGKTQLFVPATQTIAEVQTAISDLGQSMSLLTGASLRGVDVNLSYTEDAPTAAQADVLVEDRGQMVVLAGAKKPTYSIPGILPALVKANGNLDATNINLRAFWDDLIDGAWTDSNGNAITRVLKAYGIRRRTSDRQRPQAEDVNFDGLVG